MWPLMGWFKLRLHERLVVVRQGCRVVDACDRCVYTSDKLPCVSRPTGCGTAVGRYTLATQLKIRFVIKCVVIELLIYFSRRPHIIAVEPPAKYQIVWLFAVHVKTTSPTRAFAPDTHAHKFLWVSILFWCKKLFICSSLILNAWKPSCAWVTAGRSFVLWVLLLVTGWRCCLATNPLAKTPVSCRSLPQVVARCTPNDTTTGCVSRTTNATSRTRVNALSLWNHSILPQHVGRQKSRSCKRSFRLCTVFWPLPPWADNFMIDMPKHNSAWPSGEKCLPGSRL